VRARLLAAGALAALLAGIPVVLVVVSGPPPTHLPAGHQVMSALSRPVSDAGVLRAVAVAGWALWALFAVAVITELVAVARHRPSPAHSRAGFRVPGLQGVAAALVVSAVLSGGTRHSPPPLVTGRPGAAPVAGGTPGAVPPARALAATVSTVTTGAPTAGAASASAPAPPAAAPAGYVAYTVAPYDSPWAIAEAHLGNGLRWTQILDGQGRSLVDGQQVVAAPWGPAIEDTARTIYPGQLLLLPPDAAGVPSPAAADQPPPPAAAPTPPPAAGPATSPVPPAPAPPTTVWTGTLPAGAEPATAGPVPGSAAGPAGGAPIELTAARTSRPRSVEPAAAEAGSVEPGPAVPVRDLVLGGALVASAGLNVLALRRSRQAGAARRGERPPTLPATARDTEARARAVADPGPAQVAHRALAAVDSDLDRVGRPAPGITGLLLNGGEVELIVDRPAPPPPPWRADPAAQRWRRAVASLPGADPAPPRPPPGLVPVGQRRGDGAHVLLNLDASPVTALVGDHARATALLHGVALSLAGLPWAGRAEVVLVGFGDVLARCRPHVHSVDSVRAAAADLRSAASPPAPGGSAREGAKVGAGRTPTYVLARHLDRAEAQVLREVCRPDTAVRALVAGDAGTADWLAIGPHGLELPWLGEPIVPAGVGAADLTSLDDLLRLALAGPSAAPGDAARAPHPGRPDPDTAGAPEPPPPAEPAVGVQVLGPVEITGLAGDFRRPQAREALVYLAMRRSGAAEHELDGALWPERQAVKATTRDPVVSAARSAAGGPARLPYAQGQGPDKRYRVTDQVGTDWDRFRRLHQRGRAARDSAALVAALDLVRGRPFADVLAGPGFGWLHLEGHLHAIEADVVDAADLAAELLLSAGDARRARWAAAQGLAASPYSERLWTRLMAVADALGEAQEVERILAEMDRRLDLGGDFAQLHPDTLAAYRRYSRRTRAR
jgi:DNA-binding SARP family transcriptional activator